MRLFTPRTPGSQNVPMTRLFINKQLNLVKIRGLIERVLILKYFQKTSSASFRSKITGFVQHLRPPVLTFFVKDSYELVSRLLDHIWFHAFLYE